MTNRQIFIPMALLLLWIAQAAGGCRDTSTPPTESSAAQSPSPSPSSSEKTPAHQPASPIPIDFHSLGKALISADLTPTRNTTAPAVIFVPSRNGTREDWDPLYEYLRKAGSYTLVRYDVRGHGASQNSTDSDNGWKETELLVADVRGMINITRKRADISPRCYVLVGSSVGSSAALHVAAKDTSVCGVVALSPGLDYLDLDVRDTVRDLNPRGLLLIAAKGDKYAAHSARTMTQLHAAALAIIEDDGAKHGTDLFAAHPNLLEQIKSWIDKETALAGSPP